MSELTLFCSGINFVTDNHNYYYYAMPRGPAGSQYSIVYCLWIPKPNLFP